MNMTRKNWVGLGLASVLVIAAPVSERVADRTVAAQSVSMPVFEVDASWPQKLPYNWMVGHVPSVAVDSHDHVFILSRPNTLAPEDRRRSAPPVVEFDANGKFVNAWGGPGIPGFDWPDSQPRIAIAYKNNVWIGGRAPAAPSLRKLNDDMIIKFTSQGKFLLQIGGRDKSPTSQNPPVVGGNRDTKSFHQPTDVFVYPRTHEAFVSDGYGSRRVIVLDADTGAFKRLWGAFGNEPIDVLPASSVAAPAGVPGGGGRGVGGGRGAPP